MTPAEIRDLRLAVLGSLHRYERAKDRFRQITRAYERRHPDAVTAEILASGDPRRKSAADDCAWYGAEIERYAAALTALVLSDRSGL